MTAVHLCECKHPQARHQGGTYWCLTPDCDCKRYTPDFAAPVIAPAAEGDLTYDTPSTGDLPPHQMPVHIEARAVHRLDSESTSARLRRVTEQRDGLVQVVEQLSDDVLKLAAALKLARAELASARTELNGLRAANDQLRADYSAAADELEQLRGDLGVKRVGELEEQLALTDPQGAVISRQQRYLCETCGSRYGIDYTDHAHGPLTPVVVTITRQGDAP